MLDSVGLLPHTSLLAVLCADTLLRGPFYGILPTFWSSWWSSDSIAATQICWLNPLQTSVIFFPNLSSVSLQLRFLLNIFQTPYLGASATPAEMRERLIEKLRVVLASGSDEECSVCLESIRLPVITHCAHVYCRPCITQVLSNEQVLHMQRRGKCCTKKTVSHIVCLCLGNSTLSSLQGWDQDQRTSGVSTWGDGGRQEHRLRKMADKLKGFRGWLINTSLPFDTLIIWVFLGPSADGKSASTAVWG